MRPFTNEKEVKQEVDELKNKIPAFSGRNYPLEYLDAREFELLSYFIFKEEIEIGSFKNQFDTVHLMKVGADRGRDLLLQFKNKNVGVIQCKRYRSLIQAPQLGREIIKFVLHSIQDKNLIEIPSNFTYYFIALSGFNDKALHLLKTFNTSILKKLKSWTEEVIGQNESLIFDSFQQVEVDLINILSKIKVVPITGDDLDSKLKTHKKIIPIFFEIEKVASESMLRKVLEEAMGFKNDEDLEKLRQSIQDIPFEKRMYLGFFNIYGFDKKFYQKIFADDKFLKTVANISLELNKKFIDYLKETIERYHLIFFAGSSRISPFSKQVVVPYLFNKYSLRYSHEQMGEYMASFMKKDNDSFSYKYQTIEEHKERLLEVGQQVLNNDYSSFVGDEDLLKLKKELCEFIHAEFNNVEEMSKRFDEDMKLMTQGIKDIEKYIEEIMPLNPTIVIGHNQLNSVEDFVELFKKVKKLE